ncbi:DUF5324 family protein [Propionimicrobium sp. PCR01-08-3]|uniref:sunset domain-containing protein n=1 Tax=Propionimicrobium sp. PCR01-08-3 TaxID=3052086 RepID=UPI00255C4A30|nr:DUF5324 family protein [Propionimicrobium sp. PCR01-08-3]WIY81681.1 DUF5324 family protein [Propionimicrobium sp. PCR01-08-3]
MGTEPFAWAVSTYSGLQLDYERLDYEHSNGQEKVMNCKTKKARKAAKKAANQALKQGKDVFEGATDAVTPLAKQANDQVSDLAKQAGGLGKQAVDFGRQAADRVTPVLEDAYDRISPKVEEVVEKLQPSVSQAYESVSDKVQHDWYPRLQEFWEEANENPSVIEATRRGRSTLAALRGDLQLPDPEPEPRKRSVVGRIFTLIGIATVVGAIIIAVRSVLGSSDDGWSPQQPTRPEADEDDSWGASPFEATTPADEPEAQEVAEDAASDLAEELAEDEMISEGSPDPASAHSYGEGAYVGATPPEGFAIKGNERSMKYHTPEAAGYERTNADVWFNSEEAAVAAGFTKALR